MNMTTLALILIGATFFYVVSALGIIIFQYWKTLGKHNYEKLQYSNHQKILKNEIMKTSMREVEQKIRKNKFLFIYCLPVSFILQILRK